MTITTKHAFFMLVAGLLMASLHAEGWDKYAAPDGSFSVHYPSGWVVAAEEASVQFSCRASAEDLTLLSVPPDLGATPRAIADEVTKLIREDQLPDLTVEQWREGDQPATSVSLRAAYTEGGRSFLADVIVAKADGVALWLSYSVPRADYTEERSQVLLTALLGSLAAGEASTAPDAVVPELATVQLDLNGRAFVFVLEFAMGAPFSCSQERLVLDAFKEEIGALAPDQQRRFDEYPELMGRILELGSDDVDSTRLELRQTLREALEDAAGSPVIKTLSEQLDSSATVVAQGEPPLLRVAAQAMGELLAFARLLDTKPQASPDDLDPKTAAAIRDQTAAAWTDLDADTRKLVTSAPGVWMVVRTALRAATPEQQATIRQQLKDLGNAQVAAAETAAPATNPAGTPSSDATAGSVSRPRDWATHYALMAAQQTTFNTHMWRMGYSGWTPMGKVW